MSEDRFNTPAEWRRHLLPRRGGLPVPYEPDPGAATIVARETEAPARIRRALTHDKTPGDISAAGLAHLAGEPDSTPLGAAAVAVFAVGPPKKTDAKTSRAIADEWVRGRGLAFAVSAAVELVDLRFISEREDLRGQDAGPAPITRHSRDRPPQHLNADGVSLLLHRLRTATAAASEEEYAAAVAALARLRAGGLAPHQAVVATFLAPTEDAWVNRDVGAFAGRPGQEWLELMLTSCITGPDRLRPLFSMGYTRNHLVGSPEYLHTLAEGLGAHGLPVYQELLSSNAAWGDGVRLLLTLIAAVPSDEAFLALLERSDSKAGSLALGEAADRFPRRAVRLLATASGSGSRGVVLGELLRTQVVRHRAEADEVAATLPEAAARRITAITARLDAVREAPAEAVPPLLAAPPWTAGGKPRKPIVVAGLRCTDPVRLEWAEGEQEVWLRAGQGYRSHGRRDFERLAEEIRAGRARPYDEVGFFQAAPEALAVPLLEHWQPRDFWNAEHWLRGLVARYGLAVFPVALAGASSATAVAPVLQPFTGPPVGPLMAEWFGRLKSVRPTAAAWLRRHPAAVARELVPAALGKAGAARRYAERALYFLAGEGHADTIRAAAEGYGPAAADGIAALLDTDPVQLLPAKLPVVPDWADAALLAPIELADGSGSLPAAAAGSVLTILAMSRIGEPYAGLAVVTQTCTAGSLAEFAWSLFQRWQLAGFPSKESWALDALGFLGDDETVRRLAPLIRAWPGEGGHQRAVAALDVLAEIGTDVALMHLHGIAEKVKFRGLKERAQEKIAEVADALGLSPEQLADRLVPDFGLEPDGTLMLDYGPRRFVVGFDEQLKPYVAEEDGKRRKDLPKPGAKDDPQLAPAAAARFAALKKDVRTVAADQIRRLERAMVWRRRWTPEEFRRFIVEHPLVWHVARRLVWAAYAAPATAAASAPPGVPAAGVAQGVPAAGVAPGVPAAGVVSAARAAGAAPATPGVADAGATPSTSGSAKGGDAVVAVGGAMLVSLRVAEDRTLAGVDDEPAAIPDGAVIGLAHPLELGDDLAGWAGVFADYEILQPFEQLARDVQTLTEAERPATELHRCAGVKVPTTKVLGLERRGWRRAAPQDAGIQPAMERDLPGGATLMLDLDPGIVVGLVTEFENQTLGTAFILPAGSSSWDRRRGLPFATLDPVTASEILRDLREVTQ
ncbi:DUF4132 domain-containing protein [Dactylosporangium sp. NPDC049140]|uniref:DUF4132 domain-containing protein n=1 Tax=Dactylosporangium sp. NPDC049140 TaxID=3155647 RepID=UPI0033CFCC68